jgi:hypothetical protein
MIMNEEIQRINLDDYIQIGEGGTALTYTHNNLSIMRKSTESVWKVKC